MSQPKRCLRCDQIVPRGYRHNCPGQLTVECRTDPDGHAHATARWFDDGGGQDQEDRPSRPRDAA